MSKHPKKTSKKPAKAKRARRANASVKLADVTQKDIDEALERPRDFGYSGDLPIFDTWALGPVVDHRDATLLAKANWKALERELESHPEWEGQWETTSANHWAVGWVDHLSFQVLDDNGQPTEIFRFLKGWFDRLEDYSIANEDLYGEMQYEAYQEGLERDINDLERKLIDNLPADWQEQMYDALRDEEWSYDGQDIPYIREDRLLEVAGELGFLPVESEPNSPGDWDNNPASLATYVVFRDPETFQVITGELVMFGPGTDVTKIVIWDEQEQRERKGSLQSGGWKFDGDNAKYQLISLITPGLDVDSIRAANVGPGTGGFLGWLSGAAIANVGAMLLGMYGSWGVLPVVWSISTLGGAVGAYMAAPEDRKQRTTIGAAVGGALIPIIGAGAALGAWMGAKEPDSAEVQRKRKLKKAEKAVRGEIHQAKKAISANPSDRATLRRVLR